MPVPDDIRAQLDALPDTPAAPSQQKSGEVGPAAGGDVAEQPGVPTDAGAAAAGRALDALPDGAGPTVGMRAAAAASQGHSPAEAAQAAALARRAGVQPRAILGDAGRVAADPAFDAAHYDDIAARHPELAQWLSEPTHAALARGDVAALRAVSTAAQGLAQPAIPDVPTDPLPILGAFKFGVYRAADSLNKTLLAGPAWLQQESRSLLGITSDPTWGTPLAIFQESVDQDRAMERIRATYAPSAMRDLIGTTGGILADPTSALLLPAEGASLAIKGSQVLGEAAQAAVAIKAAATVQAGVAGGQTAINATERARDNGGGPGRALADAANLATQASLAFFFGRAGQEIPILRGIGQTPFTAAPLRELGSDIVRNAVTGGTQSVAQGTAESLFAGQGLPDAGALVALYASGAIPGALIAGGSLHEAVLAQHHLQTLRHAETLQFANKMADTIAAVQASKAAQASPEEVGHLLDAIADRAASQGGMSHVYLQADDWQAHFQAKGEDPVAAAHQAGLGEEYARAKGLGGDMQVPLRVAIGLGADSDNPAALVARMRPAANAPTAGEAARFFQEGPDDLAKAKTFAAAQIDAARGAGDPEGQTIYEERKAQLVAAGVETRQAEDAARLHQRFFQRMAERFNEEQAKIGGKAVTATDLADQFALRVQKALPDVIENIIASGRLDRVLDTLRTAGPADAELLAARASFRTMGIDPLTQTNEQVAEALRAQGTVGRTAEGLSFEQPAYHGSPHKFDKFTTDHIGTGEGQQAFGHGLYFTGKKEIAEYYRNKLSPTAFKFDGKTLDRVPKKSRQDYWPSIVSALHQGGTVAEAQAFLDRMAAPYPGSGKPHEAWKEVADWFRENRSRFEVKSKGRIYHVELPEDGAYLRWDRPLREDPPKVRAAIAAILREHPDAQRLLDVSEPGSFQFKDVDHYMGEGLYRVLSQVLGGDAEASRVLAEHGLAGIDYPAGSMSGVVDDGTRNYVIFRGDDATITQYEQNAGGGARGTFQPPRLPGGESLIQLLGDANASTVFHESAHYFLEVMGQLADRPDAPQSIKDDFQTIMAWSGYGDRAGMIARSAELAKLQDEVAGRDATPEERARLKELAAPHETFARGFERYLMDGVAPAKGLRKAFARIKAWMVSVYQDARNLGVEVNPEVRDVFDRLLASDREVTAARRRVSDEPAFRSIDETKMTPEQWGRYQELVGSAHQAESEALEHELMEVHREVASEAYGNERKAVSVQVADQVAQERVHDAIRQLQDGETWDGRPIAEPMKIAKADVERLLTPEEMLRLPGPKRERNAGRVIYTPEAHGLPADEVAQRLGYATGHELLQDIIAAPDRQARIDELTDAEMKRRHPDPMDHQASMDHVADRALHASDIRANLMEVEKQHLAVLAQEQAKADAAAATSEAVDAERRKMQGQLDTLKARIAAKEADANDEAEAARLAAALTKGVARQSLTALRDERQTMRVAAGEMIADTKLSAFDPDRFVAAERKAAIAFGEAMAKKDYEKAIAQKRAQMMNAELARAAYHAQEQAGKDVKLLRRSATDATHRAAIGKAGGWEWTVTFPDGTTKVFDQPDGAGKSSQELARAAAIDGKGTYERTSGYLDQVDALLEGFEFKDITPREARRRATLASFLEKVRFVTLPSGESVPTGESPNIPQSLIEKAGRTSYKDMTLDDLHDLRAAVESIETMAKLKNTLELSTGKAERDAVVAECIAQLTKTATGAKRPKIVAKPSRWPAFDTLRKMTSTFFDELRMVPSLVHEMDHFKEGGPLYRAFVEPAQRAADAELEMKAEGRARFAEAIQEWGKKDDLLRTAVPGIERSFTRLERVVVLMHYGNKEGRQRLMDLHGWNDAKVHAIVDSLDAKDIALANRLVDLLSSHWSDVKAMEERYRGIAPPKVEAIPVELPNGSYVGGYQRIYYDGESATTLEHMAQQAAEDGLTGAGIRRSAKTPAGYTKERVETVKERTLSLAPGNWARAYNEIAHDLTHRDLVMNQMKLLRSKPMKDALVDHWGTGVYQQFVHQTMGLAQGNKPATTSLEKVAEYLRVTSNYSRRAFNPAYALIQEAGLPLARTRVGDRYLASAALQLYSGPLGLDHTAHWIAEQSTAMRYRLRTRDANFGDALSETTLSGSARKFMDGAGMFMVMKTWEHLDNVCWKGAYDQHMEQSGGDHSQSVHVADQIVESVMGSAKQKDLAQIQRIGGPLGKVFTSNMNWALANWGQIAVAWNQTGGGLKALGSGGFRQMAHGLGALATLCVVGPMLWDWMYDEMKGEDMKAWTTGKGLATKVVASPVYAAMSSVPILRDLAPAVIEGRNQQGGTTGLNWLKAIQAAASALHARRYGEGTAKAVVAGAATFLPLPTSALFQAIDGHAYAARHHAGFVETAWRMLNGAPLGKK